VRRPASGGQVALDGDEAVLAASEQRPRRTIEAFGVHKEIIKARYTAAKATASVSQVVGGAHEEMGEVALATRRAEETTARLQARAQALDELLSDPDRWRYPAAARRARYAATCCRLPQVRLSQ
jgi:phage shock protein A